MLAPVVPPEALTSRGYVIRVFDLKNSVPYDGCRDGDQKEQAAQARYNAGREPGARARKGLLFYCLLESSVHGAP